MSATIEERSEEGLFGYGRAGLPGEIDLYLRREGAIEELAMEIIDRWIAWAEVHRVRGRRRVADSQLPELNTLASILIRYHIRNKLPPSPIVAFAIEHLLGLINPKSGAPIPAASVLKRFGLPVVNKMEQFLEAARLDGEADAAGEPHSERTLAILMRVSRDTIGRWRLMEPYKQRRAAVRSFTHIADAVYNRPGGRSPRNSSAN